MGRDIANERVKTLLEYQYSFTVTYLGYTLTVAVKIIDLLARCLCYSTKMYGGWDTAQCQAFETFLNTLNCLKQVYKNCRVFRAMRLNFIQNCRPLCLTFATFYQHT